VKPIGKIKDSNLAKVFTNVNLSEIELDALESQFKFFYQEPENQFIYDLLVEKGVKLKFLKEEIYGSANYNRTKKAIVFPKSDPTTTIQLLQHELFHAYQDKIYPNLGLYSKGKEGFINIEFEVAFMQFLLTNVDQKSRVNFDKFIVNNLITGSHLEEFEEWANRITFKFTNYPFLENEANLKNYFIFMKYFGEDKPTYNSKINYKLKPLALIHFLNQL
jgi:hypothetical protein